MKQNFFLLTFVICCFLLNSSFPQRRTNTLKLTGNWEFINQYNDRGLMMQLKPDHTLTILMVLANNYKYTVKGNKMITSLKQERTGKVIKDTTTIRLTNSSLISTRINNGKKVKTVMLKTRKTRTGRKNIVGNYSWKYPGGRRAFSRFTKDGNWFLRIPVQTIKGTYSVKDSVITFTYTSPKKFVEKQKYRFNGNTLILTNKKTGKDEPYEKIKFFPNN